MSFLASAVSLWLAVGVGSNPAIASGAHDPAAASGDERAAGRMVDDRKNEQAMYADWHRALVESLRASPRPRDRTLVARMTILALKGPKDSVNGKLLRDAAKEAPDDPLVQWLWANAPDRVSGCDPSDPCPHRAEALTRLEPDNGAAWWPVVAAAWDAGDVPAAEAALAKAAEATRYDEPMVPAIKAWMEIHERHPFPSTLVFRDAQGQPYDPKFMVFRDSYRAASAVGLYGDAPLRMCDGASHRDIPVERLRHCGQLGRLMLTQGGSQIDRGIGKNLLDVSLQESPQDRVLERIVDWRFKQYRQLLADQARLPLTPAAMEDWLASRNQAEAAERALRRAGIALEPPSDWQPDLSSKPVPTH